MFTDEYFERQLQNIREIRLSERKFYQKVTDLYATAFDYDKNAKPTKRFFRQYKIKCIGPFIGIRQQNLLLNERMRKKNIWD